MDKDHSIFKYYLVTLMWGLQFLVILPLTNIRYICKLSVYPLQIGWWGASSHIISLRRYYKKLNKDIRSKNK
jgi:hypothetical protein